MLFGLSVFALTAVAIGAFMVAVGKVDPVLATGAIFLLAAGQIAIIITLAARAARLEQNLSSQQAGLRALSERADQSASRLAHIEQTLKSPTNGKLDELIADMKVLRDGFRNLLKPVEAAPAADGGEVAVENEAHEMMAEPSLDWAKTEPRRTAPDLAAAKTAAPRSEAQRPVAANQRLDLLLEPVVELSTGATAHYRALLDLTDDAGHVVQHAELMEKADLGGMRPALDTHMMKHVLPVLRRLRNRNPVMRVFVPVGASTLSSAADMSRLEGLMEREIDAAGGIVIELKQGDLAALNQNGIEGLARLGRLGATLSIADVQAAGLDLAALRQLGVRFLSFPPAAADAGFGPAPAWREFIQYARAMQFQIIMGGVDTMQQASAARAFGRFGHGSFFAPPRKVRADAGAAASQRHATAA